MAARLVYNVTTIEALAANLEDNPAAGCSIAKNCRLVYKLQSVQVQRPRGRCCSLSDHAPCRPAQLRQEAWEEENHFYPEGQHVDYRRYPAGHPAADTREVGKMGWRQDFFSPFLRSGSGCGARRPSQSQSNPTCRTSSTVCLSLKFASCSNDKHKPVTLHLSPGAKSLFISYYDEHGNRLAGLSGELAAAWSKLEGYALRLALVHYLIRWASDDKTTNDVGPVDVDSMTVGIRLSSWFAAETKRVYAALSEDEDTRDQRELAELIQRRRWPHILPRLDACDAKFVPGQNWPRRPSTSWSRQGSDCGTPSRRAAGYVGTLS